MGEDKEDIKARIIESARKRFEHYGFNKTTVEEIAEDAGIGKGSVYIHFKSKNDILIEIIVSFNQCILTSAEEIYNSEPSIKERFRQMIKTRFLTICDYVSTTPHGSEFVQAVHSVKEDLMKAVKGCRDNMVNLLAQTLIEGNKKDILDVKNPEKVANYIATSFEVLLPGFRVWESKELVEDYIDTLIDLYFEGMIKR